MDNVNDFFATLSSILWGWPMIVLLLGTHVFLTVRLRFPQRKLFTAIRISVQRDKSQKGDVSQFGALATALAATIGTGNIIGVATAVALGGPGAVFWCWLTGVFGISTKYSEALLAIKYRVKSESGRMLGGPMYTLERGLGWRKMGILFAVFTAIAAFGIGCTVQANAISTIMHASYGISTEVSGGVLMLLSAAVIIGGVRSISKVCSMLVPLMALLYVLGCIFILCVNAGYVMPFSNESGLGSAPIVAAAARTKNPVRQALVSSTGTFWDTVVICALTGLVIVSSIIAYPDIDYSNGAELTKMAFSKIPVIGPFILSFGLLTFAFSTILGWGYYGERAMEYLKGKRWTHAYRMLYIVAVFVGSVANLTIVWNIADCMNALMAIPNLLSLIGLNGIIVHETRKYLWRNRLDREMND